MGLLGGFAASNTEKGSIKYCYSMLSFSGSNYTAGGFAGENKGKIAFSYCEDVAKNLTGGFAGGMYSVEAENCFFISGKDPKGKTVQKLWDKDCYLAYDKISSEDDAIQAGFDCTKIWKFNGKKPTLMFIDDTWYHATTAPAQGKKIAIKSVEDLNRFIQMVNGGDKATLSAYVTLEHDLDLKGKTVLPIGEDRSNAFSGVFDGKGHSISNFVIKGDDLPKKGFFGYLKGSLYNLVVDCKIKGEGICGGLVAVNEGTISCCGSVVSLYPRGKEACFGGLVGTNEGRISQSYAAGNMSFLAVPVLPILVAVLGVAVIGSAIGTVIPSIADDTVYRMVAEDPDQVKVEEGDEDDSNVTVNQEAGKNVISFTFDQSLLVSKATGKCSINFTNPSSDTNLLVISLQLTDETALTAMGTTGRSQEEQAALEATEDYDPTTSRVTIAESGAISPGYALSELTLNDLGMQNLTPGTYDAYIVLTPYDQTTYDKAMVQAELPVSLKVIQ